MSLLGGPHDPAHLAVRVLPDHKPDFLGCGNRMFRLPALSPEPFRKQGMGMRAHGDPVGSLCAGYSAKAEISSRFTDMRTRVVKILTTLAQDTDTVFIFPVHDGSPDLCLAFPEGFGSKFRYFHIIPSPRFVLLLSSPETDRSALRAPTILTSFAIQPDGLLAHEVLPVICLCICAGKPALLHSRMTGCFITSVPVR